MPDVLNTSLILQVLFHPGHPRSQVATCRDMVGTIGTEGARGMITPPVDRDCCSIARAGPGSQGAGTV